MSEPDFIVIRPAVGLPPGSVPAHLDGRWYDRSSIPESSVGPRLGAIGEYGGLTAAPAGRFEVRESDGAVAEVWEIRP